VLGIFSSLSGYMASREGLTYALAAERVYGLRGVIIPSLWAGIVCVGWLAFSIGVVAEGFIYMSGLPSFTYYILAILLTFIFSTTAYLGVKHIVKLSYVGVPLLVVLIIAGVSLAIPRWGTPSMGVFDVTILPLVFGLVLGTFVNGSIVLSFDYQRFCRKPLDAVLTGFINFLGFWSFIIILSGIPAAVVGMDLYGTYMNLGLLPLALITLFLLAWTSADNQLYSASLSWTLSLKTLGKIVDRRKIVIAGAILTSILAIIKLHTFAIQWLILLTSISLPAGIVIWTEYYVKSRLKFIETPKAWNIPAFIAWALGSLVIYYLYAVRGLWYGLLIGFFTTFIVYLVVPRK
jgi:cytosine permease